MNKIRCYFRDLLLCFSNTQALITPTLSNHHQQVAYLSFRLSEQIGLPFQAQKDVFLAALVHDIGALSTNELLSVVETEPVTNNSHAFKGAKLIEGFQPLKRIANLVKFHHIPWKHGEGVLYQEEAVSQYSHLIHIADRFCAKIQMPDQNILSQLPRILQYINQRADSVFEQSYVDALNQLSKQEYIWLDLISSDPVKMLPQHVLSEKLALEMSDAIDFAILLSRIIDFRSRFTACHSAGVAKVAEYLAQRIGFSPVECNMMLIAGYLHDLGKLAIDNSILEKQEKLDADEFNKIRAHTYHTYTMLNQIEGFETIKLWAAYHHERLDGKGYPFHIKGEDIPLGSRIMAVADVFTAITEDRPYRKGMTQDRTVKILNNMVKNGALDGTVVRLVKENYEAIHTLSEQTQKAVSVQYQEFLNIN